MNVTKFHIKETIFFQILCIPFEFLVSFTNMYEIHVMQDFVFT